MVRTYHDIFYFVSGESTALPLPATGDGKGKFATINQRIYMLQLSR